MIPDAFYALDTETTGLNAKIGHRIMEIAIVKVVGDQRTRYHRYINPDREPDAESLRVHGITSEMVEDMPQFHEIADEVEAFLADDLPIFAHHAQFDLGFVNAEMRRAKKTETKVERWRCSLALAQARMPNLPGHSLDTVAKALGIQFDKQQRHSAITDTNILVDVILRLKERDAVAA